MIAERLREMEFKKSELAKYIQVSRPTLDKYIAAFDSGDLDSVSPRVRKLFEYIERSPLAGKKSVISFILSSLSESLVEQAPAARNSAAEGIFPELCRFLAENSTSNKARFMELAARTSDYDDAIDYLLTVTPLLHQRRLTERQIALLKPYDDIHEIMTRNTEETNETSV